MAVDNTLSWGLTLGGACFGVAAWLSWRVWRSAHWSSVTGTIVESRCAKYSDSDGDTDYGVELRYSYPVGGRTLFGERVTFSDFMASSRARAEREATRYQPGSAVTVFYDPRRPDRCVLDRTARGAWIFLLVGSFIIAISYLADA